MSDKYRPDIDGLRAVAIILVVVFHAFPDMRGGGFAGVDVFFVISGFLITGIILEDLKGGSFSIQSFYVRRILRIYPALLVTLIGCYLLGWCLLLPEEFAALGKHIAGGAGFVANFVLWTESGYFNVQSELTPLLHLWSLGIEEQFYLVWPLFLYFAVKKNLSMPFWFLAMFAASFSINVFRVESDPVGTFYLPHTRFWELMAGAVVAFCSQAVSERPVAGSGVFVRAFTAMSSSPVVKNGCALLGLGLLTVAVARLDKQTAFPGWWALMPAGSAVLLIVAGPEAWLNRRVLSHPILVFTGLISYPLYLYHWPLLVFANIVGMGDVSVAIRLLIVSASAVLAWCTYRFIEKPLRLSGRKGAAALALCAVMAVVLAAGWSTFAADGLSFRMADKVDFEKFFSHSQYTKSHDLLKHDRHECNFYDITLNVSKETIDNSCVTPHSNAVVFVWGDSHAQHLNYGLRLNLPPDVSLLQAGSSGCPPSVSDIYPDPLQVCNSTNRFVLKNLEALKPNVVIIAQQRGHDPDRLDAVIAKLKETGVKTVILAGPVPQWTPFLYKVILRKYWTSTTNRLDRYLDAAVRETDRVLSARYRNSPDVRYVSFFERLCDGQGCLTYVNSDRKEGLITYDYGHFTLSGSEYVARTILAPVLREALGR
ncbi:MAG: acyltransferase family protein [Hyphomicrobium sp.]